MRQKSSIQELILAAREYYTTGGKRSLPWRRTRDPYRILVSEIMLQQTTVERVVPFYVNFIKKFPSARALARAPLRAVMKEWNGLGYNRRAKYLLEAAKIIAVEGYKGQKLPGVGVYTRGALEAFAFNKPAVFIETNIRTVFIHHCHSSILQNTRIGDAKLLQLVARALKESEMAPREFYAMLMDYGAHLKKQGIRLNHKSTHYTKQKKFEGSVRQARGAIIRALLKKPMSASALKKDLALPHVRQDEVKNILRALMREGLITLRRGQYRLE